TDLEMLGLLRRTEREEQLRVHPERAGFQAEANQERGALGQPGVDAPGPAAPRAACRLTYGLLVARRIETVPRDVGLRVPVKPFGLAVELAECGHLRSELEREAPLDESLLLRLIRAEQSRRVLVRLTHRHAQLRRTACGFAACSTAATRPVAIAQSRSPQTRPGSKSTAPSP